MGGFSLLLLGIIFLANMISTKLSDESLKNFYIICFDILEDIEKEIKENKTKNNLCFEESATTNESIEKDTKVIHGLINIISITKTEKRK